MPPRADRITQTAPTSPSQLYVLCQLAGWGVWMLLYGSISAAYIPHTRAVLLRLALSYALYAGYGIAVSHGLYLLLRRRWLRLPPARMVPRLAAYDVLGAAVLSALLLGVNGRLLHLFHAPIHASDFIYFFINGLFLMGGWTAVFLFVDQQRERRSAEKSRLSAELALRDAQYRALAAQVQPHFLFNALNTIRALIYEDQREADLALTRLAALLRSSLRAEQQREITLDEELEVIENYLGLEQLRFEQRLRVRIAVEPRIRSALLPPMSLQHLIENGIKHGIAHLPEGGEVVLSAAQDNGALLLR